MQKKHMAHRWTALFWVTVLLTIATHGCHGNTQGDVYETAPIGTHPIALAPTAQPIPHADNPYAGATGYLNPEYTNRVLNQARTEENDLGRQMAQVATYSTAVWLDSIAAIHGGPNIMNLRDHLNEALRQAAKTPHHPVTITVVIYNLPNRDCAALASHGELHVAAKGIQRYQADFIDPIVKIFNDPTYRSLRIVAIMEPDSLPNLVTNSDAPLCAEGKTTGAYENSLQYAIDQLHALTNVYIYLDIAHSGWLGWDPNFNGAVERYTEMLRKTRHGLSSVDGFITNTSNYTPVEEPFLPDPDLAINGLSIRASSFYDWNPYFGEQKFALDLRSAFILAGLPDTIGMLIDTSRNGWGGVQRPTENPAANNVNDYVDQSRIDRRPHRGGWCNQAGAGIGARPQADPVAGIDAYVWVKPPGESDGVSSDDDADSANTGKKFDAMCDPAARSVYNDTFTTNALPDAPHAGQWFPQQFRQLVQNAYPPF